MAVARSDAACSHDGDSLPTPILAPPTVSPTEHRSLTAFGCEQQRLGDPILEPIDFPRAFLVERIDVRLGRVLTHHPQVDTPPDDAPLWRYLDFVRFVALLEGRRARFTRSDQFEDRFESAVPRADIATARAYYANMVKNGWIDVEGVSRFHVDDVRAWIAPLLGITAADAAAIAQDDLPAYMVRVTGRFVFLSCWHQNVDESAAMWDLYSQVPEGVAIRTSVGAMRRAFIAHPNDEPIYLGRVRYLDYEHESFGSFSPVVQAFAKRKSFAHEREVRAAVINPTHVDARTTTGFDLPVDIGELIESLHVSPRAAPWVRDLVERLARREGVNAPVVQSSLYAEPTF